MESADGLTVLCFNGEIYNHRELRAELEAAGHVFSTRSDSEVLVHGYEQWGDALPDRLRGMFAFVIYDRRDRSLFFTRDPFGIKPLYYFQSGTTLLFASEIKAFLHHPRFEKSLAEDLLPLYLCFEYIPGDDTLFAGVKRLPAGHRARWQSGTLTLERYFKPTYRIDETLTLDEWAELIGATVAESCAAHAIADAEVGCFLSAGVDSSLVAAEEVKVVMSGEGADELFGGYAYYQECLDFEPYMKVPRPVRALAGNIAAALPPLHGQRFLMRGRDALPVRYIRNNYVFNYDDCSRFLAQPVRCARPETRTAPVFAEVAGHDEITQIQYADMAVWMQYDILQKADKMSMGASLELRVPFLDRKVLDVALRIPARYRVTKSETKVALRRAARAKLPERTAAMPKIGFITPLNDWLKQEPFASRIREAFASDEAARFFQRDAINKLLDDHLSGKRHNMKRIWSIYSFLLWYDEYFVKR